MSKETIVNKSETFEDWRLKSNSVSLDLGSVAADDSYSLPSLDTEARLTDQYITKNDLGDGGLYIRDISALPGGLEINYSGDRTVDNSDGYIIFKDGVTNALEAFPVGAKVAQYANNATGSTAIFTANIVSASNKKILISNPQGIEGFNSSLNLYNANQLSKFVLAVKLKEIIAEAYSHGNVRVYRTRNYQFDATLSGAGTNKVILSPEAYHSISNDDIISYTTPSTGGIYGSSGDTTSFYVLKPQNEESDREIQLSLSPAGGAAVVLSPGTGTQTFSSARKSIPQDMTQNGFHIAPQGYYATTDASSIPATFIEGEVLYQGPIGDETFKGTLLTADISGVLIFKNILLGTYANNVDLSSTTRTTGAGTTLSLANSKIAHANLTSNLITAKADYAQMIELNMPAAASDDLKVYFGSAVDAILEIQDDIGAIANLGTIDKTDIVTAINELETGLRGTNTDSIETRLAVTNKGMTATNLVMGLVEHEKDLFGDADTAGGKKSLADLGTDNKVSVVLAMNELETAIRGDASGLVEANLGAASGQPAMTANDLLAAVLEHEKDLYGTGSQTLSSLTTTEQGNFVAAINELEVAIRGTDNQLVADDLAVTLAKYARSGTNLKLLSEQLVRDIGDTTNAKLGVLNTPNVSLATHGTAIAAAANVLTMVSNPITAGIKVGMFVSGAGQINTTLGGGAFVQAVSTTQVTISRPLTAELGASVTLQFKVEDITSKIKGLDDTLGAVTATNMGTTASTVTTAIREHNDELYSSGVSFTGLDATNFQDAIEELRVDIGDVGSSGATLKNSVFINASNDLTKAIVAAGVGMTGTVEFNTAFHASGVGSLAEKPGYSTTNLHAAIRELQTYIGDASTLSNSGDTYTRTAASTMNGSSTTTLLISSGAAAVDVGYQVTMASGFTAAQIPANTVVVKVNNDAHTSFTLNNAVTVNSNGDTNNILFTEPTGYGFSADVITTALTELRNALVGGTADLTDKINTLNDSDGGGTDFNVTNIVDAIREVQDDLGQQSLITGSPFHADLHGSYANTNIVTALNAITAAIGATDIGSTVNSGNETLTNAIAQLRTDIGDVGASGASLTTTATDITLAINELDAEIGDTSAIATATDYAATTVVTGLTEIQGKIGDVSTINDATGFTGATVVGGIQEIQTDIGNVTIANMGTQTNRTKTTAGVTSSSSMTVNNTNGLVAGMTASHAGITSGQTIASIPDATTVTLSAAVDTNIASGESVAFKADSLQVKLRALDNNTGNVATIANNAGFAGTTIVDGITEIQTDIGNVSAANLGTTSGDIVTAIKEIIDGTGAAAVTVSAAGTGGASIARDAANGGFLKKVKAGHGGTAQTIVSNINYNAAGTSDINHKTTMKFGANTILDVSLATLITEAADANFVTTARKIVFGSTINDGQGIEIDRSNGLSGADERTIQGAVGNLSIDPAIIWVDGEVSARNDATASINAVTSGSTSSGSNTITLVNATAVQLGTVMTSGTAGLVDGTFVSSKNGNTIGLSVATNGVIPSATTIAFKVHNRNDLGWKVKGFKPTSTPDNADSFYQASNVDFYNAGRLFGKGTSGIDSTQNGVTVTWDPVTQHFDTSLQTIAGLSAGTTGSTSTVPVITVDTFGRITAISTANVSDALGTFTLSASSGTDQVISVNETVRISGTTNEIATTLTESGGTNTVTVGLPNNVTIGNDLTVTDRLIVSGTGANEHSTFAGNVDVSGDLTVTGSITAGGSSLGFTTTSATVSSKQIILNALAGSEITDIASGTGQALVPSASFVAHRGFKSTVVTGAVGSVTKGLRYRIVSTAASNAISASEQTALKTISGSTENLAHEEVITAVTTGHATIGSSSTITLREQELEAKIAWNEASDQWELYRASATSNGAIIAQGDTFNGTLHTSSLVTAALNTDNENKELSFVDVTNNTSTLQRSSGLLYNPNTKHLKVAEAIGIGLTGVVDGSDPFTPEGMLHIKTNVNAKDALLILESDHDNDNIAAGESGNPVIQLIQDGRRTRSAIQMTGSINDGAIGTKSNALLFSTAAEAITDNAYMHFATGGTITVGSNSSNVNLTSSSNWVPFVSIFNKTAQGGQGSALSWTGYGNGGLPDNRATFPNSTTLSLASNTSIYGAGTLVNDAGDNIAIDGSDGGAFLHVNTYIEDTTWQGRTITFSGTVTGFSINARYTGEAFVKYLLKTGSGGSAIYAEGITITKNLLASEGDLDENGNFSISLKIPAIGDPSAGAATPLPQIGFSIKGVNANGATAFADGDIDINNMVLNVTAAEDTDFAAGNPVITTDPTVRMTIASDTGHVGIATTEPGARLDVHGNFRVEGDQNSSFPITTGANAEDDDLLHTAVFASNDLAQVNTLSTTLNKQLKQAVFVSRPGYGGKLSYLDITDVRTEDGANDANGAAKRIQARTSTSKNAQGDRKGFVSFPVNSNLVEIGGIHTDVDKVGVSTNSGGATQIFHNTADAVASSKKLETTATGVDVTGQLTATTKIGIGTDSPTYKLDIGKTTSSVDNTIRLAQANGGTAIRIGAGSGDSDVTLIRVDGSSDAHDGASDSSKRGFSLKYMGARSNNLNALSIFSDNQTGTAVEAFTVLQDGKIGIGTTNPGSTLSIASAVSSSTINSGNASLHLDDRSETAVGVGGSIIFTGAYTANNASLSAGPYIKAYKTNATDDDYGFGLKFATRKMGVGNQAVGLTIDSEQKVGIGTETPTTELDVAGTVNSTAITTGLVSTTDNVKVGAYGEKILQVKDIEAGGPGTGADESAKSNKSSLRLHAGESITHAEGQNAELVYINAEGGLQVNSHPNNWLTGEGVTAGWAGKNGTVSINKPDGSSEFNQIKHTGLTMTSGTDIDQLYTLNFTPPTNAEWTDIGINGDDIATGTYVIQMYINEGAGGVYGEYNTGVMSWFSTATNDDNSDEIFLHNAGHSAQSDSSTSNRTWFLRTLRTLTADEDNLKLQIRSNYTPPTGNGGMVYTIKLRRMI